jgi:chitin disaccharide deacetylase
VNRAVEIAHREGVLTAASLMVGAPAAADAVETARRLPRLAVGLHLALVDAAPVLPADAVPDLVGDCGRFRPNMRLSGAAMVFLPRVRGQMIAEVRAQFEAYRATGLKLDHVTAHKHFHLHPSITSAILELKAEYGVKAVRAPFEPRTVLARIERGNPGLTAAALGPFARLQRRRLRSAGIATPDQVFGLAWSGAMTSSRLVGLVANLPDGVSEIYAHPATASRFAGSAPGYRYAEELAALTSPAVRSLIASAGIASGGFAGAINFRRR